MRSRSMSLGHVIWQAIRKPLGGISLIILIVIVVTEMALTNRARETLATYSATVSLLTTFAALAFTTSVISEVIDNRISQRWKRVRDITLKGLNDELRTARDILCLTITGRPPYSATQIPVRRALQLARTSGIDWNRKDKSIYPYEEALRTLVIYGEWTRLAASTLRIATQQMRIGLAQWAPLTTLARGDYIVLSEVATMADVLEALEFPLDSIRLDNSNAVRETYRQPFCKLWSCAIAGFIYVEEEVVRTLDEQRHWQSRARELLPRDLQLHINTWQHNRGSFEQELAALQAQLMGLIAEPW